MIVPALIEAAVEVQAVLTAGGIRSCVIGGTCSAEDLVIYKLVAGRARDVADIEGIVRRQRSGLDVDRIRRYGALFAELKEDPDLLRPFERLLVLAQE